MGLDEGQVANQLFWFAGTKASCSVMDILALLEGRGWADRKLLEFARLARMHSLPRAKEYLTYYLNSLANQTKEPKYFRLSGLLQDAGARKMVQAHFLHDAQSRRQNVITIGQAAYSDPDWKYSLGTYFIYYIDIGNVAAEFDMSRALRGDTRTRHVLAWGEDTYQWHPNDTKRFTQCIHEAASRLENASGSQIARPAPFRMLATEVVIDTETGLPSSRPLHSMGDDSSISIRKSSVMRGAQSHFVCRDPGEDVSDSPGLTTVTPKQMAINMWRRGGLDTLVKVLELGKTPDPRRPVGYCTTLKYVAGRTPAQIESIIGLASGTKLGRGAEIFTLRKLPNASEFDLKGYTQTPAGIATDDAGYVPNAAYPPGTGGPQWDLARVPQSRLVHIATVPAGQVFGVPLAKLPTTQW